MAKASGFPAPFQLGPWLVQAELNRVSGPGGVYQVEPRIMRVLLALVEREGGVVSRQDLLDEVWADAVVGEEILTRAISELRRVFGDDPKHPAYIETIRQHGYRLLMAAVAPAPEPATPAAAEPVPATLPAAALPAEAPAAEPPTTGTPAPDGPADVYPRQTIAPAASAALPAARPVMARLAPLIGLAVLAVALLAAASWWSGRGKGAPEGVPPLPLTSYPGRELHPALSPDGTRVAFAWSGQDGREPGIYLKLRDSDAALRLTGEPGWPAWPAWLPDGQSLVFVQTADTGSAICSVASLGGPVRRLREVPSLVEGLTVTPDGRRLAWAARRPGGGPYRLEGLALDDPATPWSPATSVGPAGDVQPRYSPDGRWLAWVAIGPGGNGAVQVAPAGGGPARKVADAHGPVGGLAWTPDSERLVFGAAPAGAYGLWLVPAAGGQPEACSGAAGFLLNPSVAGRTGDLACEDVGLDQDVWRLRVTARNPWRFETAPFLVSTRWEADADIDPSSGRVVFVSTRTGRPQLWIAGPDGDDPAPLADPDVQALSTPRWSPDGSRVAFRAVSAEGPAIWVVPAAGGRARQVPLPAGDALPTGWTHDGRALLVAADWGDGWQIHRVDPVDGQRLALTRGGGLSAAESADGRLLYHTRPGLAGLWRQALPAVADPEPVIPGLPAGDKAVWRLSDDAVLWVLRVRGRAVLMRHDLESGQSTPLTELPGFAGGALAVAAGGDFVLFAHAGEAAGDLLLFPGFAAATD